MKVIPVIDILNGKVVHAVKGVRSNYLPVKSVICDCSEPLALASAFKSKGFSELYVADLDAIMKTGNNLDVLRQIVNKTGLRLMVDSGVSDVAAAKKILSAKVSKVIVGTETLTSMNLLSEIIQSIGINKVVVSLDLKNGQIISKSASVAAMDSWKFAFELQKLRAEEIVVLDLARVGSENGVDLALLKNMANAFSIRIGVGGGVRDLNDLKTLEGLGIYEVLLATALHSGKISIDDLTSSGFMKNSS